jgi:hypothetical protein
MELEIRYRLKDGRPHLARARFPGEPYVHVSIETLEHATAKLAYSAHWTRPNMLVQMGGSEDGLDQAVAAVLEEEKKQGYRWARGRAKRDRDADRHFTIRLANTTRARDAADAWITFGDGTEYTLWAATRDGLVRTAGEGAPWFYSPNLLLVRELDERIIRRAVAALGPEIGECALPARAA